MRALALWARRKFEVHDDPLWTMFDRRVWRWRLGFCRCYHAVGIELVLNLVERAGEPYGPVPVMGWCVIVSRDLQLGAFHSWYDGENCAWWLGPFALLRFGRRCVKCEADVADN